MAALCKALNMPIGLIGALAAMRGGTAGRGRRSAIEVRQSRAGGFSAYAKEGRTRAQLRPITRHSTRRRPRGLKARHSAATFIKKIGRSSNLSDGSSVSQ
jgi:hypothetical protein